MTKNDDTMLQRSTLPRAPDFEAPTLRLGAA